MASNEAPPTDMRNQGAVPSVPKALKGTRASRASLIR